MERLKMMKENLMAAVQGQMGNLHNADTKELGEAVDMIKDLSEAIYYCSIVKAMEEKDHEEHKKGQVAYYIEPKMYPDYYPYYRDMDRGNGRMYYDGNGGGSSSNGGNNGGSSSGGSGMSGSRGYTEMTLPIEMRDRREGRSPRSRKTYMESKEMHHDKATQLKELEKYMQELTQDMVEMIEGASPEEKQYLEKRISSLATKIGQTNV